MKVVFFSDTHMIPVPIKLPEADLAVFAGDCTGRGKIEQFCQFCDWFAAQPCKNKVMVPGNHDFIAEQMPDLCRSIAKDAGIEFLIEEFCNIEGLNIYGTPYQPEFCNWAFNRRESDLDQRFDLIPPGLDLLITHCPPYGIMDKTQDGLHVGSRPLLRAVQKRRPRYHAFGHIHEGYGVERGWPKVVFINASVCDIYYKPVNPVIIEEIS